MKNNLSNTLFLLVFSIFSYSVFSQNPKINIKQNDKIDSLVKLKIALDRERYEKTYFTLQLYYGNLKSANEILEKCKAEFPHLPVDLSFETPNYKVQAGFFKDKLVSIKTLDTIKRVFPAAFLLKKTND
tara:strand:- start:159 stop:545 length:387 start_codon:yes stop_codon:yes gene_type:complete